MTEVDAGSHRTDFSDVGDEVTQHILNAVAERCRRGGTTGASAFHGRAVLVHGTLDLRDAAQAEQSPLAERLFGIPGVSGVFFGSDFITVTKGAGEWQQLKPMILGAIMEY